MLKLHTIAQKCIHVVSINGVQCNIFGGVAKSSVYFVVL